MQLSHTRPVASARFDDPNLVSCAGLVPMASLAHECGLAVLADEHLSVPTDKGFNAGAKVSCLVAGMVAGADSIDDMALLRHGAMGTVFNRPYAPSTLGSFLREFAFGHVRQLDAVASRVLSNLAEHTPVLDGIDGPVLVDLDDTIIEVHGYAKQGSGYGYSGLRGLNALIATVTTAHAAPVITGQRLRTGSCGSPRGAARMIADTLATVRRLRSPEATGKPLARMDSAFYGYPAVAAAIRGGADVSVTVRLDPKVKAAIADIPDDAWTTIEYTDAVYDETTQQWVSRAEVAEIGFTAFSSRKAAEQVVGAWWCAASPTSTRPAATGRPPYLTCGVSTRFSPPPTWIPSPPTRPTADTRSSSRSTPTSKTPPWLIYLRGDSTPTPPGWCWPSSRSTSSALRPPSPGRRWPSPGPRPSDAR
jgi:Transposase DDE domain group 1